MIFTRPFMTRQFIDYEEGDSYLRVLSIAFRPIDEFTNRQPASPLRVALKELPGTRALRNQSGFICFEGIDAGNYRLLVKPDPVTADWFYLKPPLGQPWTPNFERPIEVLPNVLLTFDLILTPKPSYPFPANATLVRGTVTQGTPKGVPNAVVSTTYEQVDPADSDLTIFVDVETLTNLEGEYVLFFKSLPQVTQQLTVTAALGAVQVQDQIVITEGQTLQANPLDLPL
jgi:hypothetical protein